MSRPTTGAKMYNRNPHVPEPLESRKLFAAGEYLDSFGDEGIINTQYVGNFDSIHVLPDGRILAGGSAAGGSSVVARFDSNGNLDRSFGDGGYAAFDFELKESDAIVNLFTDRIGRIYAATESGATVRFTALGRIDTRFGGGDGVLPNNPVVAVFDDGRFLAVRGNDLRRFNPGGGLDATFGVGGAASTLAIIGAQARVGAARALITSDGSILFGTGLDVSDTSTPIGYKEFDAVMRFSPSGRLDQSFGVNGVISIPFTNSFDRDFASPPIALDQTGRLLVISRNGISRYTANGKDPVQLNASGSGTAISVDSRGRIIVFSQYRRFQRFLPDGTIDVRFAGDGDTSGQTGVNGSPTLYASAVVGEDLLFAGQFNDYGPTGESFYATVGKISGANPTTPAYRYEPGNILLINGTEQADRIRMLGEGETITVTVGSTTQTFEADDVQQVAIYGNGGNDEVEASTSFINCVAYGGAGNDTINLRRFKRATAYGDDGNDRITIFARDGCFAGGGRGNDVLTIDLFAPYNYVGYASGGDGDDLIIGGRKRDTLYGDAGNDTIRGMGDVDQLYGNSGNDLLDGSDSRNGLSGGTGSDTLLGGGEGGPGDDFYDVRNGRTDVIREYGGVFYGNDRAIVDADEDVFDSNVEVVLAA